MFLPATPARAQFSEAELIEKIETKQTEIRDIDVQINRLSVYLDGYDECDQALADATTQLAALKDKLEEIEQKNLIKAMLQLGYETYDTIDKAANTAKAAVTNIASKGVIWAVGSLGMDQLSDELKKQMGLDPAAYYAARTVHLQAFNTSALSQSAEVEKVQLLLRRSLADYQAQYFVENGEELGERGAVFYKNRLVREQIDLALAALASIRSEAQQTRSTSETELEYCQGERGSLLSALSNYQAALEQIQADNKQEAEDTLNQEIIDAQAQWSPPPPGPNISREENESDRAYTIRCYEAAVVIIAGTYNNMRANYDALKAQYSTLFASVEDQMDAITAAENPIWYYQTVGTPSPDSYGTLAGVNWNYFVFNLHRDKLNELDGKIDRAKEDVATLIALAQAMNDELATVGNLDQLAISYPHPDTGIYGGGSYFRTIAEPEAYPDLARFEVGLDIARAAYPTASDNLREMTSVAEAIFYAIEDGYQDTYEEHSRLLPPLESAATGIETAIAALQNLCVSSPFCDENGPNIYGVTKFFNMARLNVCLAEALQQPDVSAVQTVWAEYQAFLASYGGIFDSHGFSVQLAEASLHDFTTIPPVGADDIRESSYTDNGLRASLSAESIEALGDRYTTAYYIVALNTDTLPVLEVEDLNDIALYPLIAVKEQIAQKAAAWVDESDESVVLAERQALYNAINEWKNDPDHWVERNSYGLTATALQAEVTANWNSWQETHAPPQVVSHTASTLLAPGASKMLQVSVEGQVSSYTWYEADWLSSDWTVVSHSASHTVQYSPTPKQYRCVVENEFGSGSTATIEIDPARPPEVAYGPTSVDVPHGDPAYLGVQIWGYGSLHEYRFQWYVSTGEAIAGPYMPISGATTEWLDLGAALVKRYYYVKISNQFGSTQTDPVSITPTGEGPLVLPLPQFYAYVGYDFLYQLDLVNADGFSFTVSSTVVGGWLAADQIERTLSGKPTQQGSFMLEVRAYRDEADGRVYSQPVNAFFTVMAKVPGNPACLEEQYFDDTQLADPAVSGGNADPDHDGIPNLVEYYLGLTPTYPDCTSAPAPVEVDPASGQVQVRRLSSGRREGVLLQPQYSTDMLTWHNLGDPVAIVTDQDGNERLLFPPAPDAPNGCFYRVVVKR
jgi:hypothetical protein